MEDYSMTENTAQRVQRLEAEIAGLKALHPLRKRLPVEEPGVSVTYCRSSPIDLPSPTEYEKLLAIVARAGAVPQFASESERREFYLGFIGSFERIASLRRSEGLNLKRPARDWADEAHGWLHQRGTPVETTNGSFFAAILAAGDISYSIAKPALGVPAYIGLHLTPMAASPRRQVGAACSIMASRAHRALRRSRLTRRRSARR
jgi:hypothetical protein